ncbi:Mn transporter [candidate division WOR-1 bacterium RIFCSPLOWO2_02_FULL_46_20]|uniref:Mn transporter n=2 Tax=Saganbacteria TaxID=1703751 RepID=A0A1F4RAJ6_UNCSA|nr:MAG: Mn transporter [candidate division WOR-1 bacterium RIFCSPHIGHO2_02_FULL_45_12]OGC04543.1 MAG: Mn transporter [candidate division WOR-1 bacterium RIFCSPLOWO2_02_FULL_46_20]OGC09353.1 MAG: Mn transporter [candidate division WOR-1 bacterium RIFCSPLOWO2_12_FULL_45_9]
MVLGPGIITSFADNDAGGITTYSIAGSHYGYKLLWILVLITIVLAVVQEMAARLGVVTGKGLADLIREEFGVRWTLFAMTVLLVANSATIISNFAGIAVGFGILGIGKELSIPIVGCLIWLLVLKGNYRQVERIFLLLCVVAFSYVVSGLRAGPEWDLAFKSLVTPTIEWSGHYLFLLVAFIGTTITPWMQFYLQASVVDKGINIRQYKYERLEVMLGAFLTNLVSFFIIIACAATLFKHGIRIETAGDAALALQPFAGSFAEILFAFGLIGASVLTSIIVPLSTAYAICEAFGFESGLSRKFKEAPAFYSLYTILLTLGAALVLLPGISLLFVMYMAQAIQGFLLPIILIFMLLLVNNKRLMGQHTNSRFYNIAVYLVVAIIVAASLALIFAR